MSVICFNRIKFSELILLFLSSISSASASSENVIYKKLVIKTNKENVWSALTNKSELEQWWHKGVRLEPVIGGDFYEPWGDGQLAKGNVLDLKVHDFIEFSWQEKYWKKFEKTKCRFTIKTSGQKTILEVKHYGWQSFKDPVYRKKLIEGFNKGWDSLLPKLKKHLDNSEVRTSL
jgi:uncharacterized protein YndB with AHSA1/START domain